MGRALARRERDRGRVRRPPPRTDVPYPDEPQHEHPPAMAPHRLHGLHRRRRPGRLGRPPFPDRIACLEVRHCESAAVVSELCPQVVRVS